MSKRSVRVIAISMIVLLAVLSGCSKNSPETRSKVLYSFFDTVTLVYSYAGDDQTSFDRNVAEVESVLREYHMLLDI